MSTRELTALIHIHSTLSDGTWTVERIAAAAARAGVDVLVFTDHDTPPAPPQWVHGVLVIRGSELALKDPRYDHLLVIPRAHRPLVIKAHPLDPPLKVGGRGRGYPALDWSVLWDGIELFNAMSMIKRGASTRLKAVACILAPLAFLPPPEPLALGIWDAVGLNRRWPAVAGADAHAYSTGRRWLPLRVFSYPRHMRLVTTGVWLEGPLAEQPAEAASQVVAAIAAGRAYCALGSARGTRCWLEPEGLLPGQEAPWQPGMRLEVRLPGMAQIRLVRCGEVVGASFGRAAAFELSGPGVWRVEAWRWRLGRFRPWVFVNPFYLRGNGQVS